MLHRSKSAKQEHRRLEVRADLVPLLGIAILQGLLFERIPKSLFLPTNLTHHQTHNLIALRDLALEVLRSCSSLLSRMKLRNNKYLQEVFKLKSVFLKGIWMRKLKLKLENSIRSWKNTRKLYFHLILKILTIYCFSSNIKYLKHSMFLKKNYLQLVNMFLKLSVLRNLCAYYAVAWTFALRLN